MNFLYIPTFLILLACIKLTGATVLESIGPEVVNASIPTDSNLHIFVDQQFQMSGLIYKWSFFAKQKGTFYAGIMRPSNVDKHGTKAGRTSGYWYLIHKTEINVTNEGAQDYWYLSGDRPAVQPGDAISIHYPVFPRRVGCDERCVVAEDRGKKGGKKGSQEFLWVKNFRNRDNKLSIGTRLRGRISKYGYLPSLQAHTMKEEPVRFLNESYDNWHVGVGLHGEYGVIEVKVNDVWGPICETRGESLSTSDRRKLIGEFWGHSLCQMLSPSYVMVDMKTTIARGLPPAILRNPVCPAGGDINSCSNDYPSLMTSPCPADQYVLLTCLADPTQYHLQLAGSLAARTIPRKRL